MAPTTIPFGDPRAQKKWSGNLFISTANKSYFDKKFIGEGDDFPIQRLTDLESDAGDTISFDLSVQLRQKPTYGDDRLQGNEEKLKFFTDSVSIDQARHGVNTGGKMSRKRTVHNIRKTGRDRLSDYWASFIDQTTFIYLSGSRGINENFIEDVNWAGHAENPIQSPDANHLLYGGTAKSKETMTANDKMSAALIERAKVQATMMASTSPKSAQMLPININGEKHYVCLMSEFQAHDMRTADEAGWTKYQAAAAKAEGRNNPIFKGGLGMVNNVVLHSHADAIRFNNYGESKNLPAARALLLGRQAGVVAFGAVGGFRFQWKEEEQDHGNEQVITGGLIFGIKKTRFNNQDFGILSLDTAAKDPNALAD